MRFDLAASLGLFLFFNRNIARASVVKLSEETENKTELYLRNLDSGKYNRLEEQTIDSIVGQDFALIDDIFDESVYFINHNGSIISDNPDILSFHELYDNNVNQTDSVLNNRTSTEENVSTFTNSTLENTEVFHDSTNDQFVSDDEEATIRTLSVQDDNEVFDEQNKLFETNINLTEPLNESLRDRFDVGEQIPYQTEFHSRQLEGNNTSEENSVDLKNVEDVVNEKILTAWEKFKEFFNSLQPWHILVAVFVIVVLLLLICCGCCGRCRR